MKTIKIYSAIVLSTLLLTTAIQANEPTTEHKTEHAKHWGYTGDVAPKHWSELNPKFNMCSEGKQQSPINLIATSDIELPALDMNYTTGSKSIIDNGHTVQVNINEGSTFTIGKDVYELKQFHFHTPSENNINSKSFPLEVHFVHATKDGKLAVIAVMFEEGKANPTLAKIWNKFPKLERGTASKCALSGDEVKSLMPENKEYYEFMGSLTTPPCSEQVKWHVYKTPLTISKEQVKQFFDIYGHTNNRPIQDTNKRSIEE